MKTYIFTIEQIDCLFKSQCKYMLYNITSCYLNVNF